MRPTGERRNTTTVKKSHNILLIRSYKQSNVDSVFCSSLRVSHNSNPSTHAFLSVTNLFVGRSWVKMKAKTLTKDVYQGVIDQIGGDSGVFYENLVKRTPVKGKERGPLTSQGADFITDHVVNRGVLRGLYARYFREWAELHEGAGKIHIVIHDELTREPARVLNATAEWLGIEGYEITQEEMDTLSTRAGIVRTQHVESFEKYSRFFEEGGNEALRKYFREMDETDGGLVNLLREYSDASEDSLATVRGWYEKTPQLSD